MVQLVKLPQLLAAEDWSAAEKLLRRAAGAKGAGAQVFYNLAKVIEMRGGGAKRIAWLKKAVAADARYGAAWFELGRAQIEAGDWAAAEMAFARALALDPADVDARINLARLRLRLGDWTGARVACAGLAETGEVLAILYRAACELGEDAADLQDRLLADPAERVRALKALTRVAKGSVPLRL